MSMTIGSLPNSLREGQDPNALAGFNCDFQGGDNLSIGIDGAALFNVRTSGSGSVVPEQTQANGVVQFDAGAGGFARIETNGLSFQLRNRKKLWCGARINLQDFNAVNWFVGLTIDHGETTSIVTSLPADLVGLLCTDADGTIDSIARTASVSTRSELVDSNNTSVGFTADDQWRTVAMYWDGSQRVKFFANTHERAVVLTPHSGGTIPFAEDTPLRFAIESATAAADDYLWVDTAWCYQER